MPNPIFALPKNNAALVKGLRRLPFTEESRVRIPYVVQSLQETEGFFIVFSVYPNFTATTVLSSCCNFITSRYCKTTVSVVVIRPLLPAQQGFYGADSKNNSRTTATSSFLRDEICIKHSLFVLLLLPVQPFFKLFSLILKKIQEPYHLIFNTFLL